MRAKCETASTVDNRTHRSSPAGRAKIFTLGKAMKPADQIRMFFVALLLLLGCSRALAEYPLETIPLRHQTAEQLIPLLKPFAGDNTLLVGRNDQLVIQAAPQRLAALRRLVRQFDRPPRQLLITVVQGERGQPTRDQVGQDRFSRRWGTRVAPLEQRIRATEGMPAFIESGVSLPQASAAFSPWFGYQASRYHEAFTNGFHVTPWLHDDQVTLQIHPYRTHPTGGRHTFHIQQAGTRLTGRLGEWITLGGAWQSTLESEPNMRRYGTRYAQRHQPIRIKVELLP